MPDAVLSSRALNRALLARQGLQARSRTPATATIERLVGMQAQVPSNPYLALWSRLEDFAAPQLSDLIADGRAVRAQLMRSTIHLVSARDCRSFGPVTMPVLEAPMRNYWAKRIAGADAQEVAAAGLALLAEAPRTRSELGALLAPRWPDADPLGLAYAVTQLNRLVQVPPRGLWGRSGQPRWAPADAWLAGEGGDGDASPVDAMVLRYLAAFGPATVADIRTWSGLTGLPAVAARLRPQLRTFRDERGREFLDVPDGPLPDPATPVPPRFLPEYDNVLLSHADRARVHDGFGPGLPFPQGSRAIGTLLVDGFYRANWKLEERRDGRATLVVDRLGRAPGDPPDTPAAVEAEGEALLRFLAPEAVERRVSFVPPLGRR